MENYTPLENYWEGKPCPVHGSAMRRTYTFGSSVSAETTVTVFRGCPCAVAIKHDPVGTLPSVALYCANYADAAGVGRLHALRAAAKYR